VEGALPAAVRAELGGLAQVARVEASGRADDAGVYVLPQGGADVAPAVRAVLAARGLEVAELRVERGRLDGVFRDITLAA
jgi:hypothetical protein